MQHPDIIRLFGGIRKLATALGHKNPTTVQGWADNGIPRWRWHEVLAAARRRRLKLAQSDFENGKAKA